MDKDSILRAAEAMAEQIEGPDILPEPVPTSVLLSGDNKFAILTFITPIGENTFFLDLSSADQLSDGLKRIVNRKEVPDAYSE
jgi:hypothetical protein